MAVSQSLPSARPSARPTFPAPGSFADVLRTVASLPAHRFPDGAHRVFEAWHLGCQELRRCRRWLVAESLVRYGAGVAALGGVTWLVWFLVLGGHALSEIAFLLLAMAVLVSVITRVPITGERLARVLVDVLARKAAAAPAPVATALAGWACSDLTRPGQGESSVRGG